MFSKGTGNYLSKKANYLIDANRIGNLFYSSHHYSSRELLDRGMLLAVAAAVGFLAYRKYETPESALAGAALGWFIAHLVVIAPLVYKKMQYQQDCKKCIETIKDQLKNEIDQNFSQLVFASIDQIMNHVSEKSISMVWGKRSRLMDTLLDWLLHKDKQQLIAVLEDEDMITLLDGKREFNPTYK